MRSARSISFLKPEHETPAAGDMNYPQKAAELLDSAIANTRWRQQECINLIPSEMTMSPLTRWLSIADPVGRYAEHKQVKALDEAEVFYYQGTEFIWEVEERLKREFMTFLGCGSVEARLVSGQMANATVFSAMVDYLNRADRKSEQRRMRMVMNNHIIKGGHLSAQPMGALKDYVARDPRTEKAAAVNFPVLADQPYRIDVGATRELLAEHRPELVILGKSMVLHPEPVAEVRRLVESKKERPIIMYDMAHVLGLAGPLFQEPFAEGADIVTGSTHKTFFGPQRGVVLTDLDQRYRLRLANGVLTHSAAAQRDEAGATLTTTRRALPVLAGGPSADELTAAGIEVTGDASVLARLAAVLDPGDKNFAIVTP